MSHLSKHNSLVLEQLNAYKKLQTLISNLLNPKQYAKTVLSVEFHECQQTSAQKQLFDVETLTQSPDVNKMDADCQHYQQRYDKIIASSKIAFQHLCRIIKKENNLQKHQYAFDIEQSNIETTYTENCDASVLESVFLQIDLYPDVVDWILQ